jgi:phospholipase C
VTNTFVRASTGTNPNRLYFWTANIRENLTGKALVWNGDSEYSGKATWTTFPERLSELGVDWKIYQNEISSSSAGYSGEANSWLANFGCNPMEYFPQYQVKYHPRYRQLLTLKQEDLERKISETTAGEALENLKKNLKHIQEELQLYTAENFEKLDERTKDIHRRAFVNNSAQPDYMELETMHYQEGGQQRELQILKGMSCINSEKMSRKVNFQPYHGWLHRSFFLTILIPLGLAHGMLAKSWTFLPKIRSLEKNNFYTYI